MSDRYEELAERCILAMPDEVFGHHLRGADSRPFIFAFRWLDERRAVAFELMKGELITASRAAEISGLSVSKIIEMRAKDVCECTADEVKGKGYSHCHYCGRPIVEVNDE